MTDYEIQDNLSAALRRSRVDAGKTQQEMAALIGVRYQTVQKWEYGQTCPNFINVYKWFHMLNLNMTIYINNCNKDLLSYINNMAASLPYESQLDLADFMKSKRFILYLKYIRMIRKEVESYEE